MIVVFLGVVIGDLVFFNPLKRQNWYFLGYKNSSFEYASLINSVLLVFFKYIFDQEIYF